MRGLLVFFLFVVATCASAQHPLQRATRYQLDNGLTVFLYPDTRAERVNVQLWYRAGAIDEVTGKSGLAHAFEHMMFRGTQANPGDALTRRIKEAGGTLNAFTTPDFTFYTTTVPSDTLDTVLELEADRMRNLVIDDKMVQVEMGAIREERRMRVDNVATQYALEQQSAQLYPDSRWAHGVIGSAADLDTLNVSDFRAFYDSWYRPNNATLVIAGAYNEAAVRSAITRYFGPIKRAVLPARQPLPQIAADAKRTLALKLPQADALALHRWTVPANTPQADLAALYVLARALNNGSQENGLNEVSIGQGASFNPYTRLRPEFSYVGMLKASKNIQTLSSRLLNEVGLYAAKNFLNDTVDVARKQTLAGLAFAYDDVSGAASDLGLLSSLNIKVDDFVAAQASLASVSPDDIARVAKTYLTEARRATLLLENAK
ncbi:M16 family metallopeptidase [Chitinibacteraceae bacterium HSL-7]